MADESELRKLHEDIEASAEEMTAYRSRLVVKLEEPTSGTTPWRWLWLAGPVAAALILWLVFVPRSADLPQQNLDELQSLVVSTSDRSVLEKIARQAKSARNDLTRYNANMLLCLTLPEGKALPEAALGAVTDPRAEFRAYYLEYLLDNADGYQLNPERIEERMDTETDSDCLNLYAKLLDMAEKVVGSTA